MIRKKSIFYQPPTKRRNNKSLPAWLIPSMSMFLIAVFLAASAIINGAMANTSENAAPTATTTSAVGMQSPEENLIERVLRAAHKREGSWQQFNWSVDHLIYSADKQNALVWLAPVNQETKMIMGSEPRRALAFRSKLIQDYWYIFLETDPLFQSLLNKNSLRFQDPVMQEASEEGLDSRDTSLVFGGYYLPWQEGLTKRLTWSVGHTSCYPVEKCTYAFDFADGTMFELRAAKPGRVFHWKDSCINGTTDCTNSIVIQDTTTTPVTYQIYLHIAQNSIPANLKHVGAPVFQGQVIANVDDTGYSSGHHVHFMVVTEDTLYLGTSGYYFGWAEDITFRDVFINWDDRTQGGRPRLPWEAEDYGGEGQTYYTSGNVFDPLPIKLFLPMILK